MSGLHLFRPEWLWLLVLLPLLGFAWRRRRRRSQAWERAVDPHLLPHLLQRDGGRGGRGRALVAALAFLVAVVALAGPSWRQVAQPLWQGGMPLVLVLDLSPAMLAGDLPPSRLARAREKLAVLLATREAGQVGLVVYGDDAFTVAPLTEDPANVAVFLDSLHPDVIPVPGQSASRGLAHAARLLAQAGFDRGQVLLLASGADPEAVAAATAARAAGHEVSVLGVGTAEGAPYRGVDGQLHNTRLDVVGLEAVARAGGGRYRTITDDGADLTALGVLDPDAGAEQETDGEALSWVDGGFWLLPLLMVLVLAGFRRGGGLRMLVLGAGLGLVLVPPPARAVDWWQRPDQARHARMVEGAGAYREGAFEDAARAWEGLDTADAHYNRGNALARQGRYGEALEAYDRALELQPGMEDARANREVVEAARDRQSEGGGAPRDPGQQPGTPSAGGQPGRPGDGEPAGRPEPGEGPGERQDGQDGQDGNEDPDRREPEGNEGSPPPGQAAQEAADQAQREQMARALEQQPGTTPSQDAERAPETPREREQRIANEAWLQRVPDDPGGLLREKFRIEYERRRLHGDRED